MDLEIKAMKEYFTLPKVPENEPLHQISFNVIVSNFPIWCRILALCWR